MAAGRSDERNARDSPLRAREHDRPREYHHRRRRFARRPGSGVIPVSRQTAWRPTVRITRNRSLSPSIASSLASCTASSRYRISRARSLARLVDVVGFFFPKGVYHCLSRPFRFLACDPCARNHAYGCLSVIVEKRRGHIGRSIRRISKSSRLR